jgi:hypothetical protein
MSREDYPLPDQRCEEPVIHSRPSAEHLLLVLVDLYEFSRKDVFHTKVTGHVVDTHRAFFNGHYNPLGQLSEALPTYVHKIKSEHTQPAHSSQGQTNGIPEFSRLYGFRIQRGNCLKKKKVNPPLSGRHKCPPSVRK